MFQNGISQNAKCVVKDGFCRDSHILMYIFSQQIFNATIWEEIIDNMIAICSGLSTVALVCGISYDAILLSNDKKSPVIRDLILVVEM